MNQFKRGSWIPESLNTQQYQSVLEVFEQACKKYPDKPAYSSFGHSMSYSELDCFADAFAVYLQTQTDLQPGDRIAIQLPNVLQYPVTLFGAMRAGLIIVNTNPLYTPRELEHQFNDAQVKALVVFEGVAHAVGKIIEKTSIEYVFTTNLADLHNAFKRSLINWVVKHVKKLIPSFSLPSAKKLRPAIISCLGQKPRVVRKKAEDIVVLQYTGGTTGVSRGVKLSHANLVSNMLQAAEVICEAPSGWNNVVVSPLPLYHIYAFTVSLIVMESGGQSVLIANPRDTKSFVKELSKLKFSSFLGLNTLFVALCKEKNFRTLDFSAFCITISGGMALTKDCAQLWQSNTGTQIMEGYGLTETSPIVAVNPVNAIQIGSIGFPVKETKVRIIDEQGQNVTVGEPGELCVCGPQVMQGYWNEEAETEAVFTEDGYFKTGDIAVSDATGRLSIVDRAKDLIIVSGFNVYPNEVEDVASSHPDVRECAAIGIKHQTTGERVKLFVVATNASLQEQQLRDFCREHLASYKVPKEVKFVDELPKSNVGKVLRRMLRE